MRTNFLLDEVLSKGQPKPQVSQEGSNLPVPQAGVDVVAQTKGIEQAETVEDLVAAEKSPEELEAERAKLLETLQGVDPVPGNNGDLLADQPAPAVVEGIQQAWNLENYDNTDGLIGLTAQPKTVTWDEVTQMVDQDRLEHAELQTEIGDLRQLIDISRRVDTVHGNAAAMEGLSDDGAYFLNVGLEVLENTLKSPVPRLKVTDGKITQASLEALADWNSDLRQSVCDVVLKQNLA